MTKREKTRRILSNDRFWIGVAYFGLVAVFLWLYVQNTRITRESQIRAATIVASAETQYQACIASIPTLRKINLFVTGVEELHRTLYQNALAAHLAQPKGSAVYRAQIANLRRLRDSVRLVAGVHFTVPTVASCSAIRDSVLGNERS